MIRCERNGVVFYEFEILARYPQVLHAIFTRIGGKSSEPFYSLNVGQWVGDEPMAVQANHDLIFQALGIQPGQVVTAHQVHGARVAIAEAAQQGTIIPATDSLISQRRGVALLLRFADCLPLMLYDPQRQAIALAHVGWRGCLAGVVVNTLAKMRRVFGCEPRDVLAGLGPAIGPCCYEVGPDVITGVEQALGGNSGLLLTQPDGTTHLNLPAAVRQQLQKAGVQKTEDSGLCTHCHTTEFFSHRAEKGRTGRFAAILALRE